MLFYEKGKKLISEYDSLIWQIRNLVVKEGNDLSIAGFPFQDSRLLDCYRRFRRMSPDTELQLHLFTLSDEMCFWRAEKQPDSDLYLTLVSDETTFPDGYDHLILDRDDLCLILPPGSEAKLPEFSDNQRFLALSGSTAYADNMDWINDRIPGFSRIYKKAFFCDETSLFFRLRQGDGFTILPGFLTAYYAPGCVIVPIRKNSGDLKLAAVWRHDNPNPHIARFVQLAKETFGEAAR